MELLGRRHQFLPPRLRPLRLDMDGVVVVPRELEAEVVARALERVREEKRGKDDLAKGEFAGDVFRKYGIL